MRIQITFHKKITNLLRRKYKFFAGGLLLLFILFYFSLPKKLFHQPYSLVLLDKNGKLLQAKIADDGQWRFPINDHVPEKFREALITYEDKRFYAHPGVDVLAFLRAVKQNILSHHVVSGGSTLSMQVIRLSRNRDRNIFQKVYEMFLALRLEFSYSKNEILNLYAAHAPFGGNVIGLDAAAWRYFGRSADDLSWGEAASLAVLPNSPSLVHPGKHRLWLKSKRDHLLDKLKTKGLIDETTCTLSKLEHIPDEPLPIPQFAPHLISTVQNQNRKIGNKRSVVVKTTIDIRLQKQVDEILNRHHEHLAANGIFNGAALVLDVETGNVMAYIGNIYKPDHPDYDSHVDVITAPRSPGSTLKPILYEAMLHDGFLLPHTLIPDIPTQIAGYSPKNFALEFDGAVPANKALARSLNVPAIRMLNTYRTERFYFLLKKLGITTLNQPSQHYGLSLILGGGENSLWELAGVYSSFARILNHYQKYNGHYDESDLHMPKYIAEQNTSKKEWTKMPSESIVSAAAIYQTIEAMEELMRPGEEMLWTQFTSSQRIAWKTGTSFGFRDGWAIGITPKNVVAVWIGNADGEGRPGLTGISTAAPIMFEIFRLLPNGNWFEPPFDEMRKIPVCIKSGFRATELCESDSMFVPASGLKTAPCPYHQLVHLDRNEKFRVTSDCESPSNMVHRSWFVLPPGMEYYFRSRNSFYKPLPPYRPDCFANIQQNNPMEMIYPKRSNKIYVPVELDGKTGRAVFEAAHRYANATIHWHLDEQYLGATKENHKMELQPDPGKHLLVLIDNDGNRIEQYFEVLGEK